MADRIVIEEPSPRDIARAALPILAQLKQRDADYYAEREADRRKPVNERSFDWQSYCRHGSYIGDPYGADYLCWKCEDGISVYDEALAVGRQRVLKRKRATVALLELKDQGLITWEHDTDLFMAVFEINAQHRSVQSV
jgi:hypothetical protein